MQPRSLALFARGPVTARLVLLSSLTVMGAACASSPQPEAGGSVAADAASSPDDAGFSQSAQALAGPVPVIVTLRLEVEEDAPDDVRAQAVESVQRRVLADLAQLRLDVKRRYTLLPALALNVAPEARTQLESHPDVVAVQDDLRVTTSLKFAGAMAQSTPAHALGYTGKGVRIAVLDTGVDATHPDLAGRVYQQHCFAQGGCPPYGQPESTSALDEEGHGTHVAGILAGGGKIAAAGMAPGAELVAVRVLDKSGAGAQSDIVAGLDWVALHAKAWNVRVLNMSLGSQKAWASACDASDPATSAAIALLGKKGVAVFAAAGNEGKLNGMGNPACLTGVHSVGAVYTHDLPVANFPGLCQDLAPKAGAMACFSNRSKNLRLIAPGAPIVSDAPGGKTATMFGTSQATPVAAGVAALVLACKPSLTPAAVGTLLRTTGKQLKDAATGLKFPLVQAMAALQSACPTK